MAASLQLTWALGNCRALAHACPIGLLPSGRDVGAVTTYKLRVLVCGDEKLGMKRLQVTTGFTISL